MNVRKHIFTASFFSLFCWQVFAGTLSVSVKDAGTNSSINGAMVSLSGASSQSAATGSGIAKFADIPGGAYSIEVSAQGYEGKTGTIILDFTVKERYEGVFRLERKSGEVSVSPAIDVPSESSGDENSGVYSPETEEKHGTFSFPSVFAGVGFAIFAGLCAIFAGVVLLIFFLRWKKSGAGFKFGLCGCAVFLTFAFIICAVVSLIMFFNAKSSSISSELKGDNASGLYDDADSIFYGGAPEDYDVAADLQTLAFERFQAALSKLDSAISGNNAELYREALAYAESAVELDPANLPYALFAGRLYSQVGDAGLESQIYAEEFFRKALEISPDNNESLLMLGECLFKQERYSEAIRIFEKAMGRNPSELSESAVPLIAAAYIYDEQFEHGERFLRSVLSTDPDADYARISLALMLNMQKKTSEAANELKKVIGRPAVRPELKLYASNLLKNIEKWWTEE
jgi:tetratricopeptide (TPR) repeat protein